MLSVAGRKFPSFLNPLVHARLPTFTHTGLSCRVVTLPKKACARATIWRTAYSKKRSCWHQCPIRALRSQNTTSIRSMNDGLLKRQQVRNGRWADIWALAKAAAAGAALITGAVLVEQVHVPPRLSSLDLPGIAEYIRTHQCKNIIILAGAGISVSAGIPDFRTPGTGLYDNLCKYNLPEPTAVFDINFFLTNPAPFYQLAKELFPGKYQPTPTHFFIRLLHDRGLLLRCYTQNIDSLETAAGIPQHKLVAAHGNFDAASVVSGPNKGQKVPIGEVRSAVMAGPDGYNSMNAKYRGLVKPDVVFFGERLPERFIELAGLHPFPEAYLNSSDFDKCDLLIVIGTSLVVQPFASLIEKVPQHCPRLLINREKVHGFNPLKSLLGLQSSENYYSHYSNYGFRFNDKSNYRDVCHLACCDDAVKELAFLLGWTEELQHLLSGRPLGGLRTHTDL